MTARRDQALAKLEQDLAAARDAGLVATVEEIVRQIERHKPKGRKT